MRKLLLLILFVPALAHAGKVTEQQALSKARQFLQGKTFRLPNKSRAIDGGGQESASRSFYVFNVEDEGGFVIVSGDDRTKEVLGYAESGHLDLNDIPDNMRWWLDHYSRIIASLGDDTPVRKVAQREAKPEIEPLIKTQWDQGTPYNDQCVINGTLYYTGCVATAMAQVMNYWQWPLSVSGIGGYWMDGYGMMDALPPKTFNWSNMYNEDIAWLMRYCGQAAQMEYASDGSASSDGMIPPGLVNCFDYDGGTQIIYRDGFSANDWDDLIYRELFERRPVIYSGVSPAEGGHTFICDGYRYGYYHINWGWSGSKDSYFLLSILDSNGNEDPYRGFSTYQSAVIGIQPPQGGTQRFPAMSVTHMEMRDNKNNVVSEDALMRNSSSDDFPSIWLYWRMNNSILSDLNATLFIALYQGEEIVSRILEYNSATISAGTYNHHLFLCPKFGADLPNGTYRLEIVYEDENGTIHLPQGHGYRYVEAIIDDNILWLKNYPNADSESGQPSQRTAEDATAIIQAIAGDNYVESLDLNQDYEINIADIIILVNSILP